MDLTHLDMTGILGGLRDSIASIAKWCDCGHPTCPSAVARDAHAYIVNRQATSPVGLSAMITYDADTLEVGRVAALRIRAGRGAPSDYEALAGAFEALTRQLATP